MFCASAVILSVTQAFCFFIWLTIQDFVGAAWADIVQSSPTGGVIAALMGSETASFFYAHLMVKCGADKPNPHQLCRDGSPYRGRDLRKRTINPPPPQASTYLMQSRGEPVAVPTPGSCSHTRTGASFGVGRSRCGLWPAPTQPGEHASRASHHARPPVAPGSLCPSSGGCRGV